MSRRNHETKGAIVDGASGFRFYLDVRRLISSVFIPQSSAHIGSAAPVSSGGSQKEVNGKWVPAEDQTEDSSWVKDFITTMQKKLPVLLIMGENANVQKQLRLLLNHVQVMIAMDAPSDFHLASSIV
jgi:hypothetical protein